MTDYNFDEIELAQNPDPRCPVVLVLDCSSSMIEKRPGQDISPLDALNAGLDTLVTALNQDPLAKRRVEVSVVTYGSAVTPATSFATVDSLILPTLVASGITSTGAAVVEALNALEARKKTYRENGIQYYRPWIMLITDGLATDNISEAAERLKKAEESKSLAFFAVGVEGADLESLGKLSTARAPLGLSGLKFDELFQWLSASQSAVSASTPGDSVALPSPAGWASV
jgi:uncharacterized protein YegL